jgi:hypothetical protein
MGPMQPLVTGLCAVRALVPGEPQYGLRPGSPGSG